MESSGDNTTEPSDESPTSRLILKHILPVVCCVIVVYLSICQIIVFAFKLQRKEICCRVNGCLNTLVASNLPFLMSLAMILSSLIAGLYLILSTLNNLVQFYRPLYSAVVCFLMLAFMTMYLVLWLRQTSFYMEPAIRRLTNQPTRYFSLFQGAFIIAGSVAFTVIQVQQIYVTGCLKPGCIPLWVSFFITAAQLEIQIALLALFIWPLIKHRQNLRDVNQTNQSRSPLMGLVKRAVVVTFVSIIIDIASIGMYFIVRTGTVYNIATVLNLICTIFCFGGYKARVFPCFLSKESTKAEGSSSIVRTRSSTKMDTLRANSVSGRQVTHNAVLPEKTNSP